MNKEEGKVRNIFKDYYINSIDLVDGFSKHHEGLATRLITSPKNIEIFAREGFSLLFIPSDIDGAKINGEVLADIAERLAFPLFFESTNSSVWYKEKDSFFYKESLTEGWYLVKTFEGKDMHFKDYNEQTSLLITYVKSIFSQLSIKPKSLSTFFKFYMRKVKQNKVINNGFRSSFLFEVYRLLVLEVIASRNILETNYVWTKTKHEHEYVRLGRYTVDGLDVTRRDVLDGNSMTTLTVVIPITYISSALHGTIQQ